MVIIVTFLKIFDLLIKIGLKNSHFDTKIKFNSRQYLKKRKNLTRKKFPFEEYIQEKNFDTKIYFFICISIIRKTIFDTKNAFYKNRVYKKIGDTKIYFFIRSSIKEKN